jgi:hypothetical protein
MYTCSIHVSLLFTFVGYDASLYKNMEVPGRTHAAYFRIVILSIMRAPRDVARSGWMGRESEDAHAHYSIAKHYSCPTYTDSLQVSHVL